MRDAQRSRIEGSRPHLAREQRGPEAAAVGRAEQSLESGREEMVRKDIYGTLWTFSVKGLF